MRHLRGALGIALIFSFAWLWLAAAGAPLVWAQATGCSAELDLVGGQNQTLQSVAHCVLEKPYPYLIGQDGKEVAMIGLREVKRVERLPEEAKGDMIGLLIFEVETVGGAKKKIGLNGSTFWSGKGPAGMERIPFAKIRKIIISCPAQ